MSHTPNVVIIAGPNGAGKSTTAPALLPQNLQITRFVNADTIAQGLSAFAPEQAAFAAGRVMLRQIDELASQRIDFAFETTLSSKILVSRLRSLISAGYAAHLLYLWVPSVDLLLKRVETRVRLGGHGIPEADIRRRYKRSVINFIGVYRHLVNSWEVYDNSLEVPQLVAAGKGRSEKVLDPAVWRQISQMGAGEL